MHIKESSSLVLIRPFNRIDTMYSKFIILLTCSSFFRAFAQEYMLVPPNHRVNEADDVGPFVLYYIPTIIPEKPRRLVPPRSNNNVKPRSGPLLSRHMEPPDPDAVSSYSDFHGHPMAHVDDEEVPYNHRPVAGAVGRKKNKLKKVRDERPAYTRDHDPFAREQSEAEKSQEARLETKKRSKKKPLHSLKLSPDGDRVDFQIQGHEGPATYIFGFDTGDGKNRQFRLEERLKDGSVKGHYGYYDARGKLRTVRYMARPSEGYKEKHHESNRASSEEE